ncbi:alpha/beta fold hydrolase [Micromonospora sp. RB23]
MTESIFPAGGTTVEANGVDLCVETFGRPADPAVLLLAGSTSSMLMWDEQICQRLADHSRFVVRYDYRDTGQSVTYPPGKPPYTLLDLAADVVGVLDALDLPAAHLVGQSMGGMVAQLVALDHPDRVAGLVLVSSSPVVPGSDSPDLSGMSDEFQKAYADVQMPDWSDREQVIEYRLSLQRPCTGSGRMFEEARYRRLIGREFDRAVDIEASMKNQFAMGDVPPWRGRLGELATPTLVIHGSDDPVHPFDHATALVREIPDASLLRLDGVGHELHSQDWDTIVAAVVTHTA